MILYKTKQSEIVRLDNASTANGDNTENTGGTGGNTESTENSKKYADLAQSYAIGTSNSIRENDMTDNSKYYYGLVKDAIDNGQLAEFEYFQTYDEFEEALRNDKIRDDILVVIKDHVYTSNDNNDIIDNALSIESRHAVQNKVVTKALNDLDAKIPQIDAKLSSSSENPVQNKAIHTEIQELKKSLTGFSKINIDNELSSTSENPVQNKIIYSKLEELSNRISSLNTKLEELSNKIGNTGSGSVSSDVVGNTINAKHAVLGNWEIDGDQITGITGKNNVHIINSENELCLHSSDEIMLLTSSKVNISNCLLYVRGIHNSDIIYDLNLTADQSIILKPENGCTRINGCTIADNLQINGTLSFQQKDGILKTLKPECFEDYNPH